MHLASLVEMSEKCRKKRKMPKTAKYPHPIAENPFTPSFGTVPAVLAGRDSLLADMELAFSRAGREPMLSSLLVGPRGIGKTTLLSCIRDLAGRAGWIAVGTVALPGMLDDIYLQAARASENLVEEASESHLTSVGIGPLSLAWQPAPESPGNWRSKMSDLLDGLENTETGLLITLDEVKADLDEVATLAAMYQQLVSEGRKVALAMAGPAFV